jgi:small subunit ribosomal protein S17
MSRIKDSSTIAISENAPRRVGVVESDRRNKTRTVVIPYVDRHEKYGKFVRKRTVLHIHDERNESRVGDRVEIAECRPISRTKSWVLVRVVERGQAKIEPDFGAGS